VSSIPVAFAGMNLLQNGNFTQGVDGLDGWTTESTGNDGLPITPLVQVVNNSPDPNIAAMDVAPRGSDPLAFSPFTGLSQEFVAPADGGLEIGVDVSFGTTPDSGEIIDPNRSFDDGAIIIVVNQDDFIFIAEITEVGGVVMDPEGTIAAQGGNCTNTASTIPGLDRRLGCVFDIDVTTSQDATLDIGLENEGDGTIPFVLISNPTATPKSGNTPPVADAGPAQTVILPQSGEVTVNLDATGSNDAEDGKNLKFTWSVPSNPSPKSFSPFTSATPTTVLEFTGTYTFTVEVEDSGKLTSKDTVTITVTSNNAPTSTPTFMPTSPTVNNPVALDAGANDLDDDPLTFEWVVEDEDGNPVALDDPTSETPTFIPTESGTHTATLTVDDGNGGTVTVSIPIPVTDAPTNNPPTVTITTPNGMVFVEAEIDPNNPSQIISGDPLVFTATATDVEDDNVALTKSIDWRLLDGKLVIFSQSDAGGTWNVMAKFGPGTLSPGVYVVEADVTDSDGNAATTSTIQFTVIPNTENEEKVAPGFDMFETEPGTKFQGDDFKGEPFNKFDFDGTNNGAFSINVIGIQDTGTADTIVKRLEVASVPSTPDSDTIDIELVALQLVSVQPSSSRIRLTKNDQLTI